MLINEMTKDALKDLLMVCRKHNITFSLCGACGDMTVGYQDIPEVTVENDKITYEHPRSGRTEILVDLGDIL